MALIGSQQFSGRIWAPGIKISGMNSPAEEWTIDPNLPPLGTDPRYPTLDQIVIPRGRLLAVRPDTTSYTGLAVLTIADGVSNKPAGYTETNIFRQWQEKIQWMPSMSRQEFIEVPYVQSINGAYGTPAAGDRITAYFGSASSTAPVPQDRGKIVKWVEKKVFAMPTQTAATSAALMSANLPAFQPTIIMALNAGTVVYPSGSNSVSLAWNATLGAWVATFNVAVTNVLYSFGQAADQIAGEVIRVEPISSSHHLSGWLEWVTDNFLAWEYPPQLLRVPTTSVTGEVPATVVAGQQYRLGNKPIAPWLQINVYVTGSLTNPDGSVTTLNNTLMSTANLPFVDYTLGQYYNINPVTGDLFFSSNVTVTSVSVDYSYETAYRDGRLFNAGVIGLTDGRYSGVPGTPANLEVAGVVGSLRCIVY